MAVIGVTRNVKLRRRGAQGFGFSLRGGREYAAGFYVSDVVPGGEAHRNGLRIGDQILRVNGYPVEDAVHQEVALLAKNQQVLVLKIRSVGMIPVKDNPNDPVTWHMVQQQQKQLQYGDAVTNEIRIRLIVGEKGSLGCGVCRGIVPGLTVQGAREGGPARAAGLKAGDVIIWCNGHSLTDLPFERAIEVMRSASVLDLVVSRPIANHVYDCPEALWGQPPRPPSGYDSEGSGPSPPPQHLASPQHRLQQNSTCNRNLGNCCPPNGTGPSDWNHIEQHQDWVRKPNNTTVIRISPGQNYGPQCVPQNHQQYQQQQHYRRMPNSRSYDDDYDEEPLYDPVAPRDYECHDFDANPRDEIDRRAEYRREHGIREYDLRGDDSTAKSNGQTDQINGMGAMSGSVVLMGSQQQQQQQQQQRLTNDKDRKTVTTVEVHQPCPPAPPILPPPMPCKWSSDSKPMNAMGMQMGSTMSMGSTGSTETESSLESSCGGKDCGASTSSSLSTSSTGSSSEPSSAGAFASAIAAAAAAGASSKSPSNITTCSVVPIVSGTGTISRQQKQQLQTAPLPVKVPIAPPPPPLVPVAPTIDLGSAIAQELQRRAKQRSMNAANGQDANQQNQDKLEPRKPQNPETLRNQDQKVTHDKLMEEFKRAHQRMFSNAQQRSQSAEQNGDQSSTQARPSSRNEDKLKPRINDEAVEMQSIESFKLKNGTPQRAPKPPSTYFPPAQQQQQQQPKQTTSSSSCANGGVSKVAIRFGTYNSSRQLDQQQHHVATIRRSGARCSLTEKPESDPQIISADESIKPSSQENGQIVVAAQNNVDNLANTLNNKVTIRVNPEVSNR
ncbi:hypothetical protein QAD02_006491 [Eretmocerus hayati]|uniref:Uncharacterized protein n=1 Tax=Eretmocerus hayati TaxID=131215 RepID=A0ACC2N1C8_9HYME|nr:hypothetical protein QAD02_006491 [Eretmocerus hayati]